MPSPEYRTSNPSTASTSSKRRDGSQRKGLRPIIVFFGVVALSILAAGAAFVWGPPYLALNALAALLIIWVLRINDRAGFIRSKEMRRAFQPRRHFNTAEVVLLIGLLMALIAESAFILIR